MQTKTFTKEYYESLCELWKAYGYPMIPLQVLPSIGYISLEDDKLLAYSGLFVGPDKYGFIAFTIANKLIDKQKRYEAINSVLTEIKTAGLSHDLHAIYGFTGNNTLISLYKDVGFKISETNCTSLIMPLDNDSIEYLTE